MMMIAILMMMIIMKMMMLITKTIMYIHVNYIASIAVIKKKMKKVENEKEEKMKDEI